MYESFEDAALKELREECGPEIRVTRPRFWTVVNNIYPDEGRHYVVIVMGCAWLGGEARVMEPEKCECWPWCRQPQPQKELYARYPGGFHD